MYPALPPSLLCVSHCLRAHCGMLRAARALIPDDDDEELIEKAKANRKLRLASQKEVEGEFKKSGGFAEGEARLPRVMLRLPRTCCARRPVSVQGIFATALVLWDGAVTKERSLHCPSTLARLCAAGRGSAVGRCCYEGVLAACPLTLARLCAAGRGSAACGEQAGALGRGACCRGPAHRGRHSHVGGPPPSSCPTVVKPSRHCPLSVAVAVPMMPFTVQSCGSANARQAVFAVHL